MDNLPRCLLKPFGDSFFGPTIFVVWILALCASAGPFTDEGTQPLSLSHSLRSPGRCGRCHGDFEPSSNHEPSPTWAGSMMANASRDPLFWAALDVANNDLPGVGDFCLRCHVPQGWLAGRSEPPNGSTDGCSLLGKIDANDRSRTARTRSAAV